MLRIFFIILFSITATRAAPAGWPDERASGAFIWHADHALREHAALLAELPQLEQEVRSLLALPPLREPIHIFVFARQETYAAYLKQHFPQAPARRAVFLKGRGPGMVFAQAGQELAIDLRHECTHAILNAAVANVPLWLDEGLAEFFEVPPAARRSGSAHSKVVESMVRVRQLPRLEALEAVSELRDFGRDEYRDAWAWTQFLLAGTPEGPQLVRDYLADLHKKRDPGPFSARIRQALPQVEERLLSHYLTAAREESIRR